MGASLRGDTRKWVNMDGPSVLTMENRSIRMYDLQVPPTEEISDRGMGAYEASIYNGNWPLVTFIPKTMGEWLETNPATENADVRRKPFC